MKRIFAAVLSAMLVLSLAACTDSTENSSQTSSGSSSVAEQSSEPDTSDLTVKEDVSNLDTNSEAEPEQSEPSQPEQNSSQAASQAPVEQKPAETSKPEKEEDVSKLDTKTESQPEKPAEQPSQPSTPAAPETEDTGWTQEKVDAVVEAYRNAALERGWTEDTRLNVELTNGGAWTNPIDTSWASYENEVNRDNINEYLYMLEYSVNKDPEDMSFNNEVINHGNGQWEIYFIFG